MAIFKEQLGSFIASVAAKFAVPVGFQPEDQLKSGVATVIEAAATDAGVKAVVVTEVNTIGVGRPDMAVVASSLLNGHVELKAPGKGAVTTKYKGADREQWSRFADLPNILYTDGNEWALYRTGEQVGKAIRIADDVTSPDGKLVANSIDKLAFLLKDFLSWAPLSPTSPQALASMLAPLCRYLRAEVIEALSDSESNLSLLSEDWRTYLFPQADNYQFADAYAQTLTYALLLAHLSGAKDLTITAAARQIKGGHALLSDALRILGDDNARESIDVSVSLLQRVIAAVDVKKFSGPPKQGAGGDPWLYFYEDFLSEYDANLRKDRGVYYTPVPVVLAQVRLVGELLESKFDAHGSFVDEKVVTLDPAVGTGTYVLTALDYALERVAAAKGDGIRVSSATTAAQNMHAFELLVGPYAVAHLRVTQKILQEGGALPKDGIRVYLTDTLEAPHASPPGHLPLALKPLGEEHKRAQRVKAETPVFVCIGNPPYDRQQVEGGAEATKKGGWVRFGDAGAEGRGILADFVAPLQETGDGVHAKNLYNDYVYFWRWALWKVFETTPRAPGVVSFITASSYLRGPGFKGMRKLMRTLLDELWIIDLEGDNLGARKTENVFNIQTPVAVAIGVRYGETDATQPAVVHYSRIEGSRDEKLAALERIDGFRSIEWRQCSSEWTGTFLPAPTSRYEKHPRLTDIFPWQLNGVKVGRSWPIATDRSVLERRWSTLLHAKTTEARRALFKNSPTGRNVEKSAPPLPPGVETDTPLAKLPVQGVKPADITRYGYRSLDNRWIIADARLIDRPNPDLWRAHGDRQVYLISLLTEVFGHGPAAVATANIPDLHHFMGSFGGNHVIPLWRDAEGTVPNINEALLAKMAGRLKIFVSASDLFAYAFGILSAPAYVATYWDELREPGPRVPLTVNAELFAKVRDLGKHLLFLETYASRFVPTGGGAGKVPRGHVSCTQGTPSQAERYPVEFMYFPETEELRIGSDHAEMVIGNNCGIFKGVRSNVLEFTISGFGVVTSWLYSRMANPKGRKSSDLDSILPESWKFDAELLDLLWVVDHLVDAIPTLDNLLSEVLAGETISASSLPAPLAQEQRSHADVRPATLF